MTPTPEPRSPSASEEGLAYGLSLAETYAITGLKARWFVNDVAKALDRARADATQRERERAAGMVMKWGDETFSKGATATLAAAILADTPDDEKGA